MKKSEKTELISKLKTLSTVTDFLRKRKNEHTKSASLYSINNDPIKKALELAQAEEDRALIYIIEKTYCELYKDLEQ